MVLNFLYLFCTIVFFVDSVSVVAFVVVVVALAAAIVVWAIKQFA